MTVAEADKVVAVAVANHKLEILTSHCSSSSIAANPSEPIRIPGSLLPQTLRAMMCFGKTYNLEFIEKG